jgi:ferredoxin
VRLNRAAYRLHARLGRTWVVKRLLTFAKAGGLRWLPPLPRLLRVWQNTDARRGPRSLAVPEVPAELLSCAGIARDPEAERRAFEEWPLPRWSDLQPEATRLVQEGAWLADLPTLPKRTRWQRKWSEAARSAPATAGEPLETPSAEELTAALKQRAAELGLSAIGVAPFDPKYTFRPYLDDWEPSSRVVVCILEQNYEATQTAPSVRADRAHENTYARLMPMVYELAEHLRSQGFVARESGGGAAHGVAIHYAVEAGLGQLGLNGQLLTPFAGSRCRIYGISTNAPLVLDAPVDYGINGICDACKACVRRCPTGAITSVRKWHRGVLKAKIKTERCLPMVAQVYGCAVCMKVCPVQRYGLPAVLEEYTQTKRILGMETDELEGYDWPVDGKHYGPGEKPRSATGDAMLRPDGFTYDPDRRELPGGGLPPNVFVS